MAETETNPPETTEATPETPPDTTDPASPPPEDDELAGLDDRARHLVERANTEAAAFRRELRDTRQTLERLQRQHESEQERIVREAEERGRAAAQSEHQQELAAVRRDALSERVKARAAGRFADVDDVVLYLDIDRLAGETDARRRDQQIDKALADLLERKPHLAPRQATGVLISQGARSQQPDGRRERSWLRG